MSWGGREKMEKSATRNNPRLKAICQLVPLHRSLHAASMPWKKTLTHRTHLLIIWTHPLPVGSRIFLLTIWLKQTSNTGVSVGTYKCKARTHPWATIDSNVLECTILQVHPHWPRNTLHLQDLQKAHCRFQWQRPILKLVMQERHSCSSKPVVLPVKGSSLSCKVSTS